MVKTKSKIINVSDCIDDKILTYKVVKSNDFIQAKSDFTAVQHRIILFALVQIKPSDESLQPYKIKVSTILKGEGHYHLVRKAVKGLQGSTISIRQKGGWKPFPFIVQAREIKTYEIYIELQFAREIQQFLLDLRGSFTSYTLANVINFDKNYSLRIYELCKQYAYKGCRSIKMEFLRTVLSLDNKYKKFTHFKLFVLDPSIQEINEHSDISLKVDPSLRGKKVDSLNFNITKNKIKAPRFEVKGYQSKEGFEVNLQTGFDKMTTRRLLILQFDDNDINEFEATYSNERMIEVLGLCDNQKTPLKNPRGFIVKALKLGWIPNKKCTKNPVNYNSDNRIAIMVENLVKRVN